MGSEEQLPATQDSSGQLANRMAHKDADLWAGMGINIDEAMAVSKANASKIDLSQISTSRMSIVQQMTQEMQDQVPGYQAGMVVDSQARDIISSKLVTPWLRGKIPEESLTGDGVNCIKVILIALLPNEYMKWKANSERVDGERDYHWKTIDIDHPVHGKEIRAGIYASDGGTFKEKGVAPPITVNHNGLFLPVDPNDNSPLALPMIGTFAKTSSGAGRRLEKYVKESEVRSMPIFGTFYWLWTYKDTKGKNTYYVWRISKGGKTTSFDDPAHPDTLKQCFELTREMNPDTEKGRTYMENILNAADIEDDQEDVGADSGAASDVGSDDSEFDPNNFDGDGADQEF